MPQIVGSGNDRPSADSDYRVRAPWQTQCFEELLSWMLELEEEGQGQKGGEDSEKTN